MSTPTTQTSDAPAASAAADAVVANTATTATSSASMASVVTSTVTTSSSPKRTISLGEYKQSHKPIYARDLLPQDFDVGSDVDVEEGEEGKESSFSERNESSVGTRRSRKNDSDASRLKRSRSGSDRPLADAGPLSSPRGGDDDDSIPSATVTSRTNPVRDPWMPSPSGIQSRYGNTSPLGRYALYSCSAINDDDVTKELDFNPATDQRRDYYIRLFHELRFYGNKKHSRKSKVTEWEALCQSCSLRTSTATRLATASEFALRVSSTSATQTGPRFCGCTMVKSRRGFRAQCRLALRARCQTGGVRLSERDVNGYTGISVPVELKTVREKLIT
ncbi:hypothetical protein PR001_g21037 [Phytophthora rubi]|uniref:Uncharacterized protein n=1 Tax=Phytophthora rubi TaxID=129364 RepID=A0A6A3JJB6_9STRA|nr:hypothetical protein PR001_g21037 [Phytophthora rubi]